jgi:ribosomal protein L16 Arg81 hydroxylase
MTQVPAGLAALIKPFDLDEFFKSYWEEKPLLIQRQDAAFYAGLITSGDLDSILSRRDTRYPAVRLAKNGGFYPPEAYTRSFKYGDEAFSGVIDIDRVQAEYRSGATVVMPMLHRPWRPVAALCAGLEAELDHAVHANAYLTTAGVQGFTPHYDGHEAFVLQIAGHKQWRVYPPVQLLPNRGHSLSPPHYAAPAPILEPTLNPGDLLYLPRGYVHSAATSDSLSAHVTIGVTVYTWIELVTELLLSSRSKLALRKALPTGFASRADRKTALKDGLQMLLDQLRDETDYDGLAETFAARVRGASTKIDGNFRSEPKVK